MTDRYNALIVVLEKDIREDDAQITVKAIEQIRGVRSVIGNVANIEEKIAEERIRGELEMKIWEVLHPKK